MNLLNKSVLITGADGFIGSHLTEALVNKGCRVRALSYYNSFNYQGWLEDIPCRTDVEILSGDVRDPEYCRKITKDIDIVFHLAALIAIPYSYHAPNSYIDTNVKGTLHICQAAMDNGVARVISTSTSEVYGTAKYVPIDENHPLQPQSPYSASKIGADAIAMSFFNAFSLPVTIVRPFNTFGPRQSARAVIPNIISQIAAGKNSIDLGDTSPTRDFSFVKDTCKGFILAAESDKTNGEILNIGTGTEFSIEETFNLIRKLMSSDVSLHVDEQRLRPRKSEVFRLLCNNEKSRKLIGFNPDYTFEQGLIKTIAWFENPENLKKYKTNIYNL